MVAFFRPTSPVAVVSLGTTVLDEIHPPADKPPILSVPGGSGLFATLGARIAVPASDASTIGCLVLAGDDLPDAVAARIRDWGVCVHLAQQDAGKNVTRGRLRYLDESGDEKRFEYLSPPLRASPEDIVGTPLLRARAFHLFGSPDTISRLVPDLLTTREREGLDSRPLLVWEPAPAACTAENLDAHIAACRLVDVFSPNNSELNTLAGCPVPPRGDMCNSLSLARFAHKLVNQGSIGPDGNGVLVLRCGPWGVDVLRRDVATKAYPAYYNSTWGAVGQRGPGEVGPGGMRLVDGAKVVVDSTGAGNAFLGGFAVGWLASGGDVEEACVRGAVSASFAVEQIGLPVQSVEDGRELWNGMSAEERLDEFRKWIAA